MLQFIRKAAVAATLLFAPFAAQGHSAPHGPAHETAHARADLAPGQSKADYYAWLARAPEHRAQVRAFRAHLAGQGLERVVPVWQLVRTSSSWRQCAADRFEVAPADKWAHIAATLRFVRDEVVPAIGPVEALSAYRNEALNACSDGAPQSAHRLFFALDLTPVEADVSRAGMIHDICAAHARRPRLSGRLGLLFGPALPRRFERLPQMGPGRERSDQPLRDRDRLSAFISVSGPDRNIFGGPCNVGNVLVLFQT